MKKTFDIPDIDSVRMSTSMVERTKMMLSTEAFEMVVVLDVSRSSLKSRHDGGGRGKSSKYSYMMIEYDVSVTARILPQDGSTDAAAWYSTSSPGCKALCSMIKSTR